METGYMPGDSAAVTFLSPIVGDHLTFERVTFSPSQRGHKDLPGGLFFAT